MPTDQASSSVSALRHGFNQHFQDTHSIVLPLDHGIGGGGAPPSALSVGCSLILLGQGIDGAGEASPSALRYCESTTPPPVDHGIGGGGAPPSARIWSKFSR